MIWTPRKKIIKPRYYQRGIIGAASSAMMSQSISGAGGGFSPIIYGRVHADGYVCLSDWLEFALSPASASATADVGIWLIATADNCYVRCGVQGSGDFGIEQWYNTSGTGQGDPGTIGSTGATVFELGAVPDTVNIYNANDNTIAGAPSFTNVSGTYTSDDKSTFFSPTTSTKYGRRCNTSAFQSGFGTDTETGEVTIQFTFRKSGETDYTVTFRGRATSEASVDF